MSSPARESRRRFLKKTMKTAAGAGLAVSFPSIVPPSVLGANAPSNQLVVGNIGLGWRGKDLLRSSLDHPDVRVAALSDCDREFLIDRRNMADEANDFERVMLNGNERAPRKKGQVDAYEDYRRVLDREDIDAVFIATPDHWHAKVSIDAMNAGKDVYCEKPLSLTIDQGRAMVRATRENGRVFQTGSQQRSNDRFRTACEYAQSGRLGPIDWVRVTLFHGPDAPAVPDEPIPGGLNWDAWLGATPYVPYNPRRCHVQFRGFFAYSGGIVTDWGAHHIDIAQWGLGMDATGPISVEGTAKAATGAFDTLVDYNFKLEYANGIKLYVGCEGENGTMFHGPKGQIHVDRSKIWSEPASILEEPLTANDVHLYASENHFVDFLNCVKTREKPICDVEIGHRSATVCHLANICGRTGRSLEWDPENELFVNDADANSWLSRPPREPYRYY